MTKRKICKESIKIFEEKKVRTIWDEELEKSYVSIVDAVEILTDSKDFQTARKYWNKPKQRLKEEGNETVTDCHQLKIKALMRKNIKGTKVVTMTNDTYKKMCQSKLKKEIEDIKRVYINSINEAGKFYVR